MTLRLQAPASKSMTQRALIIAALCDDDTQIDQPLDCDDSRYLGGALRALGCRVEPHADRIAVSPAPFVAPDAPLYCGNAGTAVRFGACLSLICDGALIIDGDDHMRQRPIAALGDTLGAMGVDVQYLERTGCPPLRLERTRRPPDATSVDVSLSSQYASGIALVAPHLAGGLTIALEGRIVSDPYIDMTIAMMQRAGARASRLDDEIRVEGYGYGAPRRIAIEPDWSAAAFLLAAGRITDRDVDIEGLPPPSSSLQGDSVFEEMLAALDAGQETFDVTDTPDLIAPLTATALFAAQPVQIRGAAHTRVKESDRVAVLCRELAKLGAELREHADGLDVTPLDKPPGSRVVLNPHDDHRMAMAFGVIALRVPNLEVDNPACVSKSFPDFWEVLAAFR